MFRHSDKNCCANEFRVAEAALFLQGQSCWLNDFYPCNATSFAYMSTMGSLCSTNPCELACRSNISMQPIMLDCIIVQLEYK